MISSGTVRITPAAIWLPTGMSRPVYPWNCEIATTAVKNSD
jgi:hypothetical protein